MCSGGKRLPLPQHHTSGRFGDWVSTTFKRSVLGYTCLRHVFATCPVLNQYWTGFVPFCFFYFFIITLKQSLVQIVPHAFYKDASFSTFDWIIFDVIVSFVSLIGPFNCPVRIKPAAVGDRSLWLVAAHVWNMPQCSCDTAHNNESRVRQSFIPPSVSPKTDMGTTG